MTESAGYKIYGTKGCFIKNRSDIQEADLIAGKKTNSPDWGVEATADYGTLYSDMNGYFYYVFSGNVTMLPQYFTSHYFRVMAYLWFKQATILKSSKSKCSIIFIMSIFLILLLKYYSIFFLLVG